MAVATNNPSLVLGFCKEKPNISLKSVSPLLPPNPISFLKNANIRAYVIAWVIIDRYTPLTRDLNASVPKIKASNPGPRNTITTIQIALLLPAQYQGISVQLRKTMKSGRSGLP